MSDVPRRPFRRRRAPERRQRSNSGRGQAHWNDDIPGDWNKLHRLDEVGSYIGSHCKWKSGVYRLVGLAKPGVTTPAILDRICGRDETGRLYIGCSGKRSTLRSRLPKLVRSLQTPRSYKHSGEYSYVYNEEHNAGTLLRMHLLLSERFPINALAITWFYDPQCFITEGELLARYVKCFGEAPPLNRQHA